MFQEFTINSLTEFADGKVAAAFNRLLRQAVADCMDRAGEESARTVDLSISIKPVIDQDGMAESVNVEVKIGSKLPKYHSAPTNCNARTNGQLFFNDLSLDDADQRTIDETK